MRRSAIRAAGDAGGVSTSLMMHLVQGGRRLAAAWPVAYVVVMMAEQDAATLIDARIAALGDWRGDMLARVRALIRAAAPGVVEEWKWRGTPVWSLAGIICTGESYADKIKLTFLHGAALPDPTGLFNASLAGNARRAIDLHQGAVLDDAAFTALIRAAAARNEATRRR